MRFAIRTCCLLAVAACLSGCQVFKDWFGLRPLIYGSPKPSLAFNVLGEMTQITDRTVAANDQEVFDATGKTARLFGAANETLALQVLMTAPPQGATGVRISFGDMLGPKGAMIPADQFAAFRMMPVKVTSYPSWYLRLEPTTPQDTVFYDALVPASGGVQSAKDRSYGPQPYDLKGGERLAMWVDLSVPRTTPAGVYTGRIRLQADGHDDCIMPLRLEVYDLVLPDQRPLAAVGSIDHKALFAAVVDRNGKGFVPVNLDRTNPLVAKGLVLLRQIMVLSHDHRLDLFDRTMHPAIKRDLAGRLVIDWEDYDAIVKPYLDGSAFADRIGCPAWPVPFSSDWPPAQQYGGIGSEEYADVAGQLLAQCRDHLAANLGFADQLFAWPYRGDITSDGYRQSIELARLIRSADSQTPILSTLPVAMPVLTGVSVPPEFARSIQIAAAPAQWLSPAASPPARGKLTGVFLAPGAPPYLGSLGLLGSPQDVRAIAWLAMKYDCKGILLPEVLNWEGDVFSTAAGAETRLFYPGAPAGIEGVLPSVRLKRLRRGLQDITYLALLRQRGRGQQASMVLNSLARYTGADAAGDNYLDARLSGWSHDAGAYEAARLLMACEIQAQVHPSEQTQRDLLAQQMRWKVFDDRTHTVQLEQVRSRVVPQDKSLLATVDLEVYNEFSRDADLLVKIERLPDGWQAARESVRISPLPAFARRTVTFKLTADHVPTEPTGKLSLPISITVDMASRRDVVANIPFVVAGAVANAPAIDGELEEWPMRSGNSAGAFRLVGARGQGDKPQAIRQTLAYVNHDAANLYIGMRCDEPAMDKVVASPSNRVRFEQLMACGEDLVEIVLDPGVQAKGPQDLYHIIIKPNGVMLTTKGIATQEPLGKVEPWAAGATLAIRKLPAAWIVELAVPLDSLGPGACSPLWGVNFCRFATAGAESSSWAEAPRYFYDPRNLGTMFLAP